MFYFDSIAQVLSMGGHGVFVWASYGITAVLIAWLMIHPMRAMARQRKLYLEAAQREARVQRSSNAPRS